MGERAIKISGGKVFWDEETVSANVLREERPCMECFRNRKESGMAGTEWMRG